MLKLGKYMIKIRSPGRICLMGEHQDYLGFPVISMAISQYIYIEAERIHDNKFIIELPDMNDNIEIILNNKYLDYDSDRDYLKSGYNQFLKKNISFLKGYKIKITGDIPINAGVASSSALVIGWIYFLNFISNRKLKPYELAIEGYNTEVKEFKEGGGMMDHFSSVYGNVLYLNPFTNLPDIYNYSIKLDGFVLGNSMEKKETVDDLKRVKATSLKAFKDLKEVMPNFNPFNSKLNEIEDFLPNIKKEYQPKIIGNIINRDLTEKTKNLIENNIEILNKECYEEKEMFYRSLGKLLNEHQDQLRDNIGISTKKIDKMILKCLEAGAYGGKINGSGFGGTMFALLPYSEKEIKQRIEETDSEVFIIQTSNGVALY